MKKIALVAFSTFLFISCGGGDTKAPAEQQTAAAPAMDPVLEEKTLDLIGSKGCTACHAIDKKMIGPAYLDVSKKYEASEAIIDTLANKVIKGGKGVWGDVPMTANTTVTPEEAKQMVTYILSLKNQ